jgi:hypothetical protein
MVSLPASALGFDNWLALNFNNWLAAIRTSGHTKAQDAEAGGRVVPAAVARPAAPGAVVPATPAVHAVRALKDRPPQVVLTPTGEIANS